MTTVFCREFHKENLIDGIVLKFMKGLKVNVNEYPDFHVPTRESR